MTRRRKNEDLSFGLRTYDWSVALERSMRVQGSHTSHYTQLTGARVCFGKLQYLYLDLD